MGIKTNPIDTTSSSSFTQVPVLQRRIEEQVGREPKVEQDTQDGRDEHVDVLRVGHVLQALVAEHKVGHLSNGEQRHTHGHDAGDLSSVKIDRHSRVDQICAFIGEAFRKRA